MLFSCTGEIETTEVRETQAAQSDNSTLVFEGLREAKATADDKIELFFRPATGGSPTKEKIYLVNVTEIDLPISLPESVLVKDFRGNFKYTIQNLSIGTSYTISVDVKEEETEYVKKTDRKFTIKTFNHYVSDFMGITSVTNASGPIGSDTINVRWGSPTIFNSGAQVDANADYLEVTAIDASQLTPTDMNNINLTSVNGRYVKTVPYDPSVNEVLFRGLPANTKFYVQVRCIHQASINDIYEPELRSEQNTNYLTISTLRQEFEGVGSFTADSFIVDKGSGKLALSSVSARWAAVDAVFDHYRVYFHDEDVAFDVGSASIPLDCSSAISKLDGVDAYCKRIDYDVNSTSISSLKKLKTYNFNLVLCLDFACQGSDRIILATTTQETKPPVANHAGLTSVTPATGADALGKMILNFPRVNFDTGYFDGFVIEMSNDQVAYSGAVVINDNSYLGELNVLEYDYLTDTQIIVDNIDYSDSSVPFCFTIYPFLYDSDGLKETYPNGRWECSYPDLSNAVPSLADFEGLDFGLVSDGIVSLRWFPPASGLYSHFEVYYRKTAGAFNLSEAINETTVDFDYTNYGRVVVAAEDDVSNYVIQIENLEEKTYQFGISTYFASPSGILRSEQNSVVLTCDLGEDPSQCVGN